MLNPNKQQQQGKQYRPKSDWVNTDWHLLNALLYGKGTLFKFRITRAVRGSDYSPAIVLSEEKDKFVTENLKEKWTNKGTNKQ